MKKVILTATFKMSAEGDGIHEVNSLSSKTLAEELASLTKEELIDRLIQLDTHNIQLKNLIIKHETAANGDSDTKAGKKRPFDFSRWPTQHILLKLLYLGWDFQGFACQDHITKTIEHHLFNALVKCCLIQNRETSNYHRCGRTDKGVSSFNQVISLTVRCAKDGDPPLNYATMLNRILPKEIRVIAWYPVNQNFSARFDCTQRTYKYFFPRGDMDIDAMNTALEYLLGTHDFRNFCKMDVANGVTNYVRSISSAKVSVLSSHPVLQNPGYEMCELTLVGKAFLWHQVRCIVGVLFLIGSGKESPSVVKQLLDVSNCKRKPQYAMAHEVPLSLFNCEYELDNKDWIIDKDSLSEVIQTLQKEWTMLAAKEMMVGTMLDGLHKLSPDLNLNKQSVCLLQGVTPRTYVPLMERPQCESLEEKIRHYSKKQKLQKPL